MKISVVTVVYNSRRFIRSAIDSVLDQRYNDVEYIVIDGGSCDGTLDEIEPYRDRIDYFISEPDRGPYEAMNKGLAAATGEWVAFLNADDMYAHDAVLTGVARRLSRRELDCLYGDLVYVRPDDPERVVRYWRAGRYSHGMFRRGWMPPHPTFFARRELFERWGGFEEKFDVSADYELMFRFLHRYRARAGYLSEVLVHMRTGGLSDRSLATRIRANWEVYEAWRINGFDPPWYTPILKPLSKLPQFVLRPRA